VLRDGGEVEYNTLWATVRLFDEAYNEVGTVRSDTYYNLCRDNKIYRIMSTFMIDHYRLAAGR
jgi:hypothetical protein